jgi:hypothetical protein
MDINMHIATKAFRVMALCFATIAPAALWAQVPTVAVFEPEELLPRGEKPHFTPSAKAAVWLAVEQGLVSAGGGDCTLVDRETVRQAMDELNIRGNSKVIANRQMIGQRLAADLMCLTAVADDRTGVSIRLYIVDAVTGEQKVAESGHSGTKKETDLAAAAKALAVRVLAKLGPPAPAPKPEQPGVAEAKGVGQEDTEQTEQEATGQAVDSHNQPTNLP